MATATGGCEGCQCQVCKQIQNKPKPKKQYTCQSSYVVYRIASDCKDYIGQTDQKIKHRMDQHKSNAKLQTGEGKKFLDHFKEHEFSKAKIYILEGAKSKKTLLEKEKKWIADYKSFEKGLNSTRGG